MIRAILIDDEPKAIQTLQLMLEKYCPEVLVVNSYSGINEIIENPISEQIDVVFLDINFGKYSGFDMIKKVNFNDAAIVFVSAHDNYGIEAIKNRAFDYLVKPIDPTELINTVNKLIQEITKSVRSIEPVSNPHLLIPVKNSYVRVYAQEIYFVEADGAYSKVYEKEAVYFTSKSIKFFEDLLPSELFFRVHNSYLVNISLIKSIRMGRDQPIILMNNKEVPVSRNKRKELMALLA